MSQIGPGDCSRLSELEAQKKNGYMMSRTGWITELYLDVSDVRSLGKMVSGSHSHLWVLNTVYPKKEKFQNRPDSLVSDLIQVFGPCFPLLFSAALQFPNQSLIVFVFKFFWTIFVSKDFALLKLKRNILELFCS